MPVARVLGVAAGVFGVCYLMLDSGAFNPERAPAVTSVSLGILTLVFGVSAWAMQVGGRRQRAPLLAGLALGLGVYAVARLFLG
jgi:hypothetical protein